MISFGNPWGLLGLLAVPAVLWLHLYRVRFPPLAVGGLFLWDDAVRRPAGGRTRDRLRPTASLWLELLAAALLGLLLGGPRVNWEATAPHLVALLDGSASMSATTGAPGDPPPTFRAAALAVLADRAAALGGDTVLTVIETGDRPRVVGGSRRPYRAALADLADLPAPASPRHGFGASLDLAARLAADGGRVLLLTDRDPASLDLTEGVAAFSVGTPRPNAALLAAVRRPSEDGADEAIFLRVRAFGPTGPVRAVLTDDTGAPLADRDLNPPPNAAAAATLPLPAALRDRPVRVELRAAGDALAADSAAVLLPEPRRPVRVAVTLPAGPARDAVQRALAALPDVLRVEPAAADLRFGPPADLADADANRWIVGVGPLPGDSGPRDAAGPFLIDRADPLAAGVSLAGAVWGGAGAGVEWRGEPISPVIAAGPRVLLGRVAGRAGAIALNVDPARGTVANTPDWPILLSNLVEARRAALPGLDRANLRVGEPARLVLSEAEAARDAPLILERVGGGQSVELAREPAVALAPPGVGVWAVRDGAGGGELARVAVRLADPREADLTRLSPGSVELEGAAAETAVDDLAPWPVALLAGLCLAAVVGDWWATRP